MRKSALPIPESEIVPLAHIAHGIAGLRILFVNVFGVTHHDGSWTLIDAGLPLSTPRIRSWAEQTFGRPPSAIILTHGHFDHTGAAKTLAEEWRVPVYAHLLEMPFLTGRQAYPPPDPFVGGGIMPALSVTYPRGPIDLRPRLHALPANGTVPTLPGWRWLHTPGHTTGHVSLFRDEDRALIVGDAFCTVHVESFNAIAHMTPELTGPPAYYTPDWSSAKASVLALAGLRPATIIPGHGQPISGSDVASQLRSLAARFDELAVPKNVKQGKSAYAPPTSAFSGLKRSRLDLAEDTHYATHFRSAYPNSNRNGHRPNSGSPLWVNLFGLAAGAAALTLMARKQSHEPTFIDNGNPY